MKPTQIAEVSSDSPNKKGIFYRWLTIALIVICVATSWTSVIDDKTDAYITDALEQALIAYASARVLNAGISVMQSAEFGAGFGINASIHPLEALDPINDIIEDFATAMIYATASLMTQKLVIEIMSASLFKWLLLVPALLFFVSLIFFSGLYSGPIFKGFLFIVMVRFLFVLTIFLSGYIDSEFVNSKTEAEMGKVSIAEDAVNQYAERKDSDKRIEELSAAIEVQKKRVDDAEAICTRTQENAYSTIKDSSDIMKRLILMFPIINEEYYKSYQASKKACQVHNVQEEALTQLEDELKTLQSAPSIIEKAKATVADLKELASYEKVKKATTDAIEAMLHLIALFIFKTIVMPIVFIMLLLRGFKALWGIDLNNLLKMKYIKG